jgi:hypothetical protein
VRLVPEAVITPASCVAEQGGFELGWYRGLDVSTIHLAMRTAVEQLRDRVAGAGGRLERLDLAVQFVGDRPALPRAKLLVGRWTPERFDAHVGQFRRKGRDTTREIVVPKELAGSEVYIYQVGGEAKKLDPSAPRYVPWKTGAYWVLACRPPGAADECFVIAATRQAQ